MRRFIVQRNIERFEAALQAETDPVERRVIAELLADARRELATLDDVDRPTTREMPARRPENGPDGD